MPSIKLAPDLYGKLPQVPTRNGFGEGLVVAGEKDKNVVVLCADLTESTRALAFKQKFPERFVEIGVAEQNLSTVASGMTLVKKIPFITSYAMFSPGRNWEQIRTTICYNNVPVKIAGAHAGVSVGPDGATHQAIEDIAITRVLPNMTVIVPCDAIETRKATIAAAQTKGPVYLRFAREKTPVFTVEETPFEIGKAEIYREGADISIIACGPLVYEALLAAKMLEQEGISAQVINNHTIKPLDRETILVSARTTGAIVTVEEHQVSGGLGSAVLEALDGEPIPVKRLGIDDRFGESGKPEELLEKFGLTAKHIAGAAREMVSSKRAIGAPKKIPSDKYFYLQDGKMIKNLSELKASLVKMADSTFDHHVNGHKNDFSDWVEHVLEDKELAKMLRKYPTKEMMMDVLSLRL